MARLRRRFLAGRILRAVQERNVSDDSKKHFVSLDGDDGTKKKPSRVKELHFAMAKRRTKKGEEKNRGTYVASFEG